MSTLDRYTAIRAVATVASRESDPAIRAGARRAVEALEAMLDDAEAAQERIRTLEAQFAAALNSVDCVCGHRGVEHREERTGAARECRRPGCGCTQFGNVHMALTAARAALAGARRTVLHEVREHIESMPLLPGMSPGEVRQLIAGEVRALHDASPVPVTDRHATLAAALAVLEAELAQRPFRDPCCFDYSSAASCAWCRPRVLAGLLRDECASPAAPPEQPDGDPPCADDAPAARHAFTIVVGDWSGDGHERAADFHASATKPIEAVREAYFAAKAARPEMCPEAFANQYEVSTAPLDVWQQYESVGVRLGDDPGYVTVEGMAAAVVWFLNQGDPTLDVRLEPEAATPTLHFYGYDAQGRHINFVGYGCF